MPYFIFKYIKQNDKVESLEYITEFDNFKKAKTEIRKMRADSPKDDDYIVKMIFADDQTSASTKLLEKREAPILREWEK